MDMGKVTADRCVRLTLQPVVNGGIRITGERHGTMLKLHEQKRFVLVAGMFAAVTLLAGCPPVTQSLRIVAGTTALEAGTAITLRAESSDPDDTAFAWSVSNEDICSLSESKLTAGSEVRANAHVPGVVVVYATGSSSGMTAQLSLTVTGLESGSHANRYTKYEGSKTCTCCHDGIAEEVHASVHYQWDGDTPDVINGVGGGKMKGMNDFCTYPSINFIGILTNLDGVKVSGGCGQCHVGMGAKPSPDPTQAQLENIDCLMCHSKHYKRKVVQRPDLSFAFEPDEASMKVPLLRAITDIQGRPNDTCINCHAYAGGGQNNKRGDIEESHRNATRDFDVHMASIENGGAGLICVDCHEVSQHHFAGRGSDLRVTDLDNKVSCTKCHDAKPHKRARLNDHTGRIDCTVCHIPEFSRGSSTEMYRDFSVPEIHPAKRLYEPELHREQNVRPEYRFWDGTSFVYTQGEQAAVDTSTGYYTMSSPQGDILSDGAMIYPFKVHHAYQPIANDSDVFLPFKMGIYFTTANVDLAITTGATQSGMTLTSGYSYVETERFMGIFHEVAPAEDALRCGDCHFGGDRMDFAKLGYTPNTEYDGDPLCASCHEDRSGVWPESELFSNVHAAHTDDLPLDCIVCHTFHAAD
ncbi:MAG: hypothetical protein IT364_27680 [Candidatus Hydrogenedentes bacterium]|nr:hypothetical protein [Candidatus Hydrogenedentota bacterium]